MTLFHVLIGLVFLLCVLGLWLILFSEQKHSKKMALCYVGMLWFVAAISASQLLGEPKPQHLEWINDKYDESLVIGSRIVEGEAIYLWLAFPDKSRPLYYSLPWNKELAQELQDALEEAEREGNGVMMGMPFEHSLDPNKPKFWALPQPAMPQKQVPEAPQKFEQPV